MYGVGTRQSIHYNIHNFALKGLLVQRTFTAIDADIRFAALNPLEVTLFLLGDFNFPAIPLEVFNYSTPTPSQSSSSRRGPVDTSNSAQMDGFDESQGACAMFKRLFPRLTEIVQPAQPIIGLVAKRGESWTDALYQSQIGCSNF